MTISTETNRTSFSGNDVTTAFAVSFQFFADADLRVILVNDTTGVETVQTITTHYTVSGAGAGSGTVTMVTAPATGETLVIIRDADYSQELDLVNNDTLDAEELEDQLDKLVIQILQLKDLNDRAFQLSEGDTSGISVTLPNTAGNALGLIRLNAGLTALEYVQAADIDLAAVSSYISTLLNLANEAALHAAINLEIGTDVQAYDADTLKSDVAATLTVQMSQTLQADTSSSGAVTCDFAAGACSIALTENITDINFTNLRDNAWHLLRIKQHASTGPYTVTGYDTNVDHPAATEPTISTTASAVDLFGIYYDGTDALLVPIQQDMR